MASSIGSASPPPSSSPGCKTAARSSPPSGSRTLPRSSSTGPPLRPRCFVTSGCPSSPIPMSGRSRCFKTRPCSARAAARGTCRGHGAQGCLALQRAVARRRGRCSSTSAPSSRLARVSRGRVSPVLHVAALSPDDPGLRGAAVSALVARLARGHRTRAGRCDPQRTPPAAARRAHPRRSSRSPRAPRGRPRHPWRAAPRRFSQGDDRRQRRRARAARAAPATGELPKTAWSDYGERIALRGARSWSARTASCRDGLARRALGFGLGPRLQRRALFADRRRGKVRTWSRWTAIRPASKRCIGICAHRASERMLPLVMDLADPSPARGWRGRERAPSSSGASPELVLCLALVHHLAITANVPLAAGRRLAREPGRRARGRVRRPRRPDGQAAAGAQARWRSPRLSPRPFRAERCPSISRSTRREPLGSGERTLFRARPH